MQRKFKIKNCKLRRKLLIINDLCNNSYATILISKHFYTPSV